MDLNSIKTIDAKRIFFLLVFVLSYLITEFGRFIYRPYIYSNDIYDFHIADSVGNFIGTITIVYGNLLIQNPNKKNGVLFVTLVPVGIVIYEYLQKFTPKGTFDVFDVYYTIAGGVLGYLFYRLIHTLKNPNRVIYKIS